MRGRPLLLTLALALVAPAARAQPTPSTSATPASEDDTLDPLRERFRAGLDKYRAGAFAEAILIWETIYRELGPEKGYRLAFNLARAYEQFGDPTRAAESYDAYVTSVAKRREAGETLEPTVEKQEAEAIARLAELGATQGRIRIAGDRSVVVRIDRGAERLAPPTGWVAIVTPGKKHTVTFDPGTADERQVEVNVALGQLVELAPPQKASATPPPQADTPPTLEGSLRRTERVETHPYSATVVYVAAGLTALSVVLPIALYARAGSIRDDYDGAVAEANADRKALDPASYASALGRGNGLRTDYEDARAAAHLSLAVPIVLGSVTAGLAAYWFLGSKEPRSTAFVTPITNGVFFGSQTRF